jgi:regulator of PEP synthase PpsR (kinase-PPPase family)
MRSARVRLHVHLISDSTGETVTAVARAALSQFDDLAPIEHLWSFVRTPEQLERVLRGVETVPGVVVYTLVSPELRHRLEERCREIGVACVAVLDPVMQVLTAMVGSAGRPRVGGQHVMSADYFSRIEAMNFAMRHDDGQFAEELGEADVVLVGVSRTSKTPTCIYLANRGIKAANVPFVPGSPQVALLETLAGPLIIGLTIRPDVLAQIRENRRRLLGLEGADGERYGQDYVDVERIREELVQARRLFARHGWPEIDVTRRSVEETAALIIQLLQLQRDPELGRVTGELLRGVLVAGDRDRI